jgi:hypothetical protein
MGVNPTNRTGISICDVGYEITLRCFNDRTVSDPPTAEDVSGPYCLYDSESTLREDEKKRRRFVLFELDFTAGKRKLTVFGSQVLAFAEASTETFESLDAWLKKWNTSIDIMPSARKYIARRPPPTPAEMATNISLLLATLVLQQPAGPS